jgi:hypothetical protein
VARVALLYASPAELLARRIATVRREAGHDVWLEDQILDARAAGVERSAHDVDVACLSKAANEGWLQPRPRSVLQLGQRPALPPAVRLEDALLSPVTASQLPYLDLFSAGQAFLAPRSVDASDRIPVRDRCRVEDARL